MSFHRWLWTRRVDRESHTTTSPRKALKTAEFSQTFQIATIDEAGDVGGYTSAALSPEGWGRVAYYDWGRGALKFARLVPPPKAAASRVSGGTARLFDADASASTGDQLRFEWRFQEENVLAALANADTPRVTVQFLTNAPPGTFHLILTVRDAHGRQDRATITVVIP